jgi:hypothetical protein
MGVDIDEPRTDHPTPGANDLSRLHVTQITDGGDATIGDGQVSFDSGCTAAVEDSPAANQKISHGGYDTQFSDSTKPACLIAGPRTIVVAPPTG